MPTFVPGSGALSLYADIWQVGNDNGCAKVLDEYPLETMWNQIYMFSPEFNAPYNMGFFYGAGCPAELTVFANFYADPYNDNPADWGVYYKVGNTGTELFIESLGYARSSYDECVVMPNYFISTKGGLGQSGNTVYVGVRKIGKVATPAVYDADMGDACPNSLNLTYGGTYDYPGSCVQFSANVESADAVQISITVAVDKNGTVKTC